MLSFGSIDAKFVYALPATLTQPKQLKTSASSERRVGHQRVRARRKFTKPLNIQRKDASSVQAANDDAF